MEELAAEENILFSSSFAHSLKKTFLKTSSFFLCESSYFTLL